MRAFLFKIIPIVGILFLFISNPSFCNTEVKIDSLTQLIKQAQADNNTDAEIILLNEVIDLYNTQGDWTKYEIMVHRLLSLAEQTENKVEIAECYNHLGISNSYKGNNQLSLEYFNKALNCNIKAKDTASMANSYENIGNVYKDLGNYEKAVEYQLKSLDIRSGTRDSRIFNNYISLTTLYGLLDNISKQDIYIAKAREELQKSNEENYEQLAIFNNQIAQIYNARGLTDSALSCYGNVVKYSEKIDWKRGIAVGKGNLAGIYADQNKNAKAIEMHWEVLKLSEDIEDCMSIAEEYLYLSVLYDKTNKLDSAMWLAERSLERTTACELAREQISALLLCADLYEKKGLTKKALATYRDYHALYDSILNLDRQNNIAALETQFQTKEKEQQIELLNAQNEVTLKEKASQRRLFILVVLALLLISIAFYYLYKNKQKTHKALKKLDDLKMGFFNNVSHELRTPLTLISSPAAQLLQEEIDPQKREHLKLINRNSQKLLGLVNQLLDLSKIDAGFYKLKN
jgi:tetratricopeptide (TPR) repeat protein